MFGPLFFFVFVKFTLGNCFITLTLFLNVKQEENEQTSYLMGWLTNATPREPPMRYKPLRVLFTCFLKNPMRKGNASGPSPFHILQFRERFEQIPAR